MLEVRNLVKTYKISKKSKTKDVVALNNVSITFPEKGLIFLLGKSGSGKSTLLNAIGGLDTFDSGEIIIKGKSSKDFSQSDFDSYRNTFIGFIFQEYNVLEEFTVAKNLSLAIELQGKNASKEAVNELLTMVEMQDFAKRKPNQLSGGQKQRVAIARALIKNPEIIMADEPTGALDSNTGKQVMETLKRLSQEKLVIIVSHDREFAEIYGDRIIELKDGKIISDVTKKEVAATKTASGISIIDNELIHIKKGQTFTQEDLNNICRQIMENSKNSDTIISLSNKANEDIKKANAITDEGNKEVFRATQNEDVLVKNYNGNFKLIKSKLKFKDSFKMGASALKNKVGKLVFTIFLSFIAFGMFGIIDTFSSFNRAAAIFHTVDEFDKKTISIIKEQEGEYSNDVMPFKESDIDLIKEKFPDIELKKIVGAEIRFGSSYYSNNYNKTIEIENLNTSSSNPSTTPYFSGMVHLTESEFEKFGLTLVSGRMPSETANNEICISKHIYDCFVKLNSTKTFTYESFLSEYYECRLGYQYNTYYKIVGIIDDGSNYSEYMSMESSQINSDYMLSQKISRELDFGFANMVYINSTKYNELLTSTVELDTTLHANGNYIGYSFNIDNLYNFKDKYVQQKFANHQDYLDSYDYYYSKGNLYTENVGYTELADNELLLYYNEFNNLFGTSTEEERKALLNGSTPLTVDVQVYNDKAREPGYETVTTYTVVGFHSDSFSYVVSSTNTSNAIYQYYEESGYNYIRLKYNENTFSFYNSYTLDQAKNLHYGTYNETTENYFTNNVKYFKNNGTLVSNGQLQDLSANQIMIPEYYLGNLASGEELYSLIDEGITLTVTSDYEGKNVLLSFNLVGVTNGDIFVSKETVNSDKFKETFTGFDYSIAVLSDNDEVNEKFIKYCETFNDSDTKYTVQLGATPVLDQFGDLLNTLSEALLYVGIGFAVFAALLLMNFISTSISYKKREIGILRALGARGSDVFGIFFNESLIIAAINFALATIATIVTCGILNNVIIGRLGLDLVLLSVGIRQIALIAGVSVLTAFISSFIPVFKISRKKPIDAINNR